MRYLNFCPPPKVKVKPVREVSRYVQYYETYRTYESKPDRIQKQAEYRSLYNAGRQEYIDCDCGARIKEYCIYAHRKSKRHTAYIQGSGTDT